MRSILLRATCLLLLSALPAEAQIVTGTTVTTGADGTVTQTQTTTANGPAATTTAANAATAQISEATAAIPGSGIAPTTTPGSGTGTEEGALLAASATKAAARYLSNQITHNNVLVFVGAATVPDFSPWLYFKSQTGRLLKEMKSDEERLQNILHPPREGGGGKRALFFPGTIAVAGKILSYFYTSYQVGGIALTPDDYMMDVAMLEFQPSWHLYSQMVSLQLPDDINKPLTALDQEAQKASNQIIDGQKYVARRSNGKDKDTPNAKADVAAATAAIAALTADITAYTNFTTGISGGSGLTMSQVSQGHAMYQSLQDPAGGVAFVKVHSTSVGTITKSNLFTNLGAMPLYTSIGLVVSYVYYPGVQIDAGGHPVMDANGNETLLNPKAGIFEVMTPYHTAGTVKTELALDAAAICDLKPHADLPNASKLCPRVYGVPDH
jgi:hypothetical protein